jgi:uncharacterized protein (UPF0276 family)
MTTFFERVESLPVLGIGISTEYGSSAPKGTPKPLTFRKSHPEYASFLEIGIEVEKGLDSNTKKWVKKGLPTTYHFLDLNLDEPEDLDSLWLNKTRALIEQINPAWICGDAGMWHFGERERGQMLLLPPVLTDDSASDYADGVRRLRAETGLEVIPENPPGIVFLGDLHILDFFARLTEKADTGMLLDVAHLAIYQQMTGREPLDGLSDFPLDRVIEIHVAGATKRTSEGFPWIEDTHTTDILPETWKILEAIADKVPNLRAVVYECERNQAGTVIEGFARISETVKCTTSGVAP